MRQTDIVIAGAGLAGSTAAAMLSRAGYDVLLVDPHAVYPPDFRCEKLDRTQIEILKKTGLADVVLKAATPDRSLWIARFGHLVEKREGAQVGIFYDNLVNTVRAEVPSAAFIAAKVTSISTSDNRQMVTLSTGETISARLFVLANGLNIGVRHSVGIERTIKSEAHSISIGFDIKPLDRPAFEFSALTCYSENPSSRVAYVAFFPIGDTTRANLFVYRDMQDSWLKQFRDTPKQTLLATMPSLQKLVGPFEVDGFVKIRPVDLYVSEAHRQPGIVLVGDAFATSCPAAGTGAGKALMDVQRLCNVHIPQWLATPGMGVKKIETYYDDPVKRAYDAFCIKKAYGLRSFSIDTGLYWTAQRWGKFVLHWLKGALRTPFVPSAVEAPALVPTQTPHGEQAYEPARARHTV
ncbi:MAG: FAD-binding monooxygenase [Rhizobium sp.]|nr:FAD-binding monooxygenase [Rhizobium sp.]